MVEEAPHGIFIQTRGRFAYANRTAEQLFGASPANPLVGQVVVDRIHPDQRDQVRERIRLLNDQGKAVSPLEEAVLDADGNRVEVEVSAVPFSYDGENGALVFISDITERKQAEEALRASEERFRTMADAMPQLGWIANADGYIYWYNKRWYEYTGTTLADMEGWGWQSVHDPEALPAVLARWKESIATGQPFDMEFPLRGADGVLRPFLTRVMPLKDATGRVTQWFGTNTDITERK